MGFSGTEAGVGVWDVRGGLGIAGVVGSAAGTGGGGGGKGFGFDFPVGNGVAAM